MGGIVNRIREWWEGADRTQRSVTVFGSLFLVLILGLTGYFASRPRFEPLYVGLNPADQAAVVEELRSAGVPVEVNAQGGVMVPAEKVPESLMRLASSGKTPASGPKGLELLDGINSLSTPAQERERIKAATEGNLARSIATLSSVESAIVHINFGKESPFGRETTPPSASVVVRERSGARLTVEEGKAIARLVQNAVAGLEPEQVSVVSATGRMVIDGEQLNAPGLLSSRKIEAEVAESRRREIELQARLDRAFGSGNTLVSVQVSLDMDTVSEEALVKELGDRKVTDRVTETMTDAGSVVAAGPTGLTPNTPDGGATGPGAAGSALRYSSEQVSNQYPTAEKRTVTQRAAGSVTAMTISVLANGDAITDVSGIQSYLDSYLGSNAGRPGFSASVSAVPFDQKAVEEEKRAAAAAAAQAQTQQVLSVLPVAALLIVGFMVVKALGKVPGRTLTMAFPGGGSMSAPNLPVGSPTEVLRDELRSEALPMQSDQTVKTVADLARTEPEIAEALQQLGVETIDETVDVEAIRSRIDVPLEQIRKMGRQRPQVLAMLLKSWLLEDHR